MQGGIPVIRVIIEDCPILHYLGGDYSDNQYYTFFGIEPEYRWLSWLYVTDDSVSSEQPSIILTLPSDDFFETFEPRSIIHSKLGNVENLANPQEEDYEVTIDEIINGAEGSWLDLSQTSLRTGIIILQSSNNVRYHYRGHVVDMVGNDESIYICDNGSIKKVLHVYWNKIIQHSSYPLNEVAVKLEEI